ncbi:uncharacterized protein VTP21DRAFT_6275 [Calcarisporiella thermophila]|uniref:uncharacterized protein n=1 Tax=Calcarisporiella thermophila TaxID=911321 RepID=UPI003742F9FD
MTPVYLRWYIIERSVKSLPSAELRPSYLDMPPPLKWPQLGKIFETWFIIVRNSASQAKTQADGPLIVNLIRPPRQQPHSP